jgi:hypothetical protein
VLNDEERTSAIGGDNAETAERIRDGSDARAASGMHAAAMWVLWSAKELSCVVGNNTSKHKRPLVVERLAGLCELWFYVGTGRFFPAGARGVRVCSYVSVGFVQIGHLRDCFSAESLAQM